MTPGRKTRLREQYGAGTINPNNNSIGFPLLNQKPLKCHLVPTASVSPDGRQAGDSTHFLCPQGRPPHRRLLPPQKGSMQFWGIFSLKEGEGGYRERWLDPNGVIPPWELGQSDALWRGAPAVTFEGLSRAPSCPHKVGRSPFFQGPLAARFLGNRSTQLYPDGPNCPDTHQDPGGLTKSAAASSKGLCEVGPSSDYSFSGPVHSTDRNRPTSGRLGLGYRWWGARLIGCQPWSSVYKSLQAVAQQVKQRLPRLLLVCVSIHPQNLKQVKTWCLGCAWGEGQDTGSVASGASGA